MQALYSRIKSSEILDLVQWPSAEFGLVLNAVSACLRWGKEIRC